MLAPSSGRDSLDVSARSKRLIGRAAELRRIGERHAEAAGGRGSLIVISGDAGIGKTSIVTEAIRQFGGQTPYFAIGHCLEHTRHPLAPITDLIVGLKSYTSPTMSSTLRTAARRAQPRTPAIDAVRARYAELVGHLSAGTAERPAILAIEDVHWADLATLDFMRYFAERVSSLRLLVLVTTRPTDPLAHDAVPSLLSRLVRSPNVDTLILSPLDDAEIDTVLDDVVGQYAISPATRKRIRTLAEGNPFYAEQLLQHATHGTSASNTFPATLRAGILAKLSQLEPNEQAVLIQASVLGREFTPELLSAVLDRPLGDVIHTLRRARDADILAEQSLVHHGLAFRHALIQEVLYSSMLAAERSLLHKRVVDTLRSMDASPERLTALAYHAWRAGDRAAALDFNVGAAEFAMCNFAPSDAAMHLERAIECAPPEDARARMNILQRLGDAWSSGGFPERSRSALEAALILADRLGDRAATAEIALRIGEQYTNQPSRGAATIWRMRGLRASEEHGPDALYFRALTKVAQDHVLRGDVATARQYLAKAAELTIPTKDYGSSVRFHDCMAISHAFCGQRDAAYGHYLQAARVAEQAGDAQLLFQAHLNFAATALPFGDTETVLEATRRALASSSAATYRAYVFAIEAAAYLEAGDYSTARRRVEEAASLSSQADSPRLTHLVAVPGILLGVRTADRTLTDRFATEELISVAFNSEDVSWIGAVCCAFVEWHLAEHRPADAAELIHRAVTTIRAIGAYPRLALLTALHGRTADIAAARKLLSDWTKDGDNKTCEAYANLFDALTTRPTRNGGRTELQQNVSALTDLELPHIVALALAVKGDIARARAMLRHMGIAAGDYLLIPSRRQSSDALSVREREIATLVGLGKSNRAIAGELSISERTVETHLTSIYGKLQLGSRIELALWATNGTIQ